MFLDFWEGIISNTTMSHVVWQTLLRLAMPFLSRQSMSIRHSIWNPTALEDLHTGLVVF